MWKRLNRQSSYGTPTLTQTTPDEKTTSSPNYIENGALSISSRPAFGRKGTGDVLKGLPDLPLYVSSRALFTIADEYFKANRYRSIRMSKTGASPMHLRPLPSTRNHCQRWTAHQMGVLATHRDHLHFTLMMSPHPAHQA